MEGCCKFSIGEKVRGGLIPAVCGALSETERAKREKEDKMLLALFMNLLSKLSDDATMEEALEELASLRADYAIQYSVRPFGYDTDDVIRLLKSIDDTNLSEREKEEKSRILIAVTNLIDFSVCEEYHLVQEVKKTIALHEEAGDEYDDYEEELIELNDKYNSRYRETEDGDFEYAMVVCRKWLDWDSDVILTYMTQGDDRVRPWHAMLEGFSAPKRDYPSWMIPPIEWGCRCYLVTESDVVVENRAVHDVVASVSVPEKPRELDDVFSESICTGGKIVGESHPYFTVDEDDVAMLGRISDNIKRRYINYG